MKKKLLHKPKSIDQIIEKKRLLQLLINRVYKSDFFEETFFETLKDYVSSYIDYGSGGQEEKAEVIYRNYIRSYNKDMVEFEASEKYPFQLEKSILNPSRYEYDIILLFSCLFASHRYRIMQLIHQLTEEANKGLFIGCGPGLEMELVKDKIDTLIAYDLSIGEFPKIKHPEIDFREKYFQGNKVEIQYDSIYLIEILEHLLDPYELLANCHNVLKNNGKIYLTTATNIPQFDHLYNFEPSHKEFDDKLNQMGFKVEFVEDILHQSLTLDIGAKNRFYVIRKITK